MHKKLTYIFDCDGVILDSNEIKSEAFSLALIGEPIHLVEKFVAYHKQHGGISRFEKFNHYFTVLRPTDNPDIHVRSAVERFGAIVQQKLLSCKMIPGVKDLLTKLSLSHYVFLVSGGLQEEIREVFQKRDLSQYFDGVYGSPATKFEILQQLDNEDLLDKPALYFGDSALDYEASKKFKFEFVFVSGVSEWKSGLVEASKYDFLVIQDFFEEKVKFIDT